MRILPWRTQQKRWTSAARLSTCILKPVARTSSACIAPIPWVSPVLFSATHFTAQNAPTVCTCTPPNSRFVIPSRAKRCTSFCPAAFSKQVAEVSGLRSTVYAPNSYQVAEVSGLRSTMYDPHVFYIFTVKPHEKSSSPERNPIGRRTESDRTADGI